MLTGFQIWARLTHKDVALASDRPDGLRGRASMDLPALAAGQAEQGELAWVHSWSLLGRLRPGGGLILLSPRGPPVTHPVIHVLLRGGSQAYGPPLSRPLGGVEGKGVLGLVKHGDQHSHLVQEQV